MGFHLLSSPLTLGDIESSNPRSCNKEPFNQGLPEAMIGNGRLDLFSAITFDLYVSLLLEADQYIKSNKINLDVSKQSSIV
jgi:hypothetical protein